MCSKIIIKGEKKEVNVLSLVGIISPLYYNSCFSPLISLLLSTCWPLSLFISSSVQLVVNTWNCLVSSVTHLSYWLMVQSVFFIVQVHFLIFFNVYNLSKKRKETKIHMYSYVIRDE